MKTVIIGGVAGGASAAARLRRLDENAEIVILERGEFISFANCGLPYYIGGDIKNKNALTLQTPQSFNRRFKVDVRIFSEAVKINRDDKTVTVRDLKSQTEYTESYDKLILSMGAKPIMPPIDGIDNDRVFTLRNIPDTMKIQDFIDTNSPKSVAIIGAGYIGLEMAENLKKVGLDVTVVEASNHCIASLDFDMACDVHNYLREKGVNLMLGNKLTAVETLGDKLKLTLSCGGIQADMVLLSVGVRPESELAADAKLTLGVGGTIAVDEHMQTSDPDIYAVGDAIQVVNFVTGKPVAIPLAGPANKQGRIAADCIAVSSDCYNVCCDCMPSTQSSYKGTQGSSVLKLFEMTVATTGITEQTAKAEGIDYDKIFTLSGSHAGYYPGANDISIKTIFERKTGKILGAQLVGFDGVDKRCDVLAVAIRAGLTAFDLCELELCYAPPFGSAKDPVNFVGFAIENVISGKVSNFHWHDIESLPRDGSITLLDVRTKNEYAGGHIDGFINIPVDDLRENLDKLDPKKVVYVHCRSGLRSYIACRMLTGNGFNCKNLTGGYRLYDAVVNQSIADETNCYKMLK